MALATFGSHGDLHPFLAVALALRKLDIEPVLAAAPMYRTKVEAEGIEFAPMRPDVEDVTRRLGMNQAQLLRAVQRKPQFLLRELLLPHLEEMYADCLEALSGADLAVTHSAAYGAHIAADKLGLPRVGIALQPMMFMSPFDPPLVGQAQWLTRRIYRLGPGITRHFLTLGKRVARRWAQPIDELRRKLGLPPAAGHPLFEGQFSEHGNIALYSSVLGPLRPDAPPRTQLTGFAFYDHEHGGSPTPLAPSLVNFFSTEERPLVFTLGTSAVQDAEHFMHESLAAVRKLHARAVFALDAEQLPRWSQHASPEILLTGYVPYSLLFAHAEIIVHHGGIGTAAQALRSGRPQLLTPHIVDQPDNAHRLERLGVARVVPLPQWQAPRIVRELLHLKSEPAYGTRAAAIGKEVRSERGAESAARIISEVVQRRAS